MGKRYLADSNVIIDFCNGKLPASGRDFLSQQEIEISIITNIELFSANNISNDEFVLLEKIVAITTVHPLNTDLITPTIKIRKNYKLKLPDAIIAATAIAYDLVLISHNTADFKRVSELQLLDLHKL